MSWLADTLMALALLGLALWVWQWIAAVRFPLHQRSHPAPYVAGLTVLKPLKGSDPWTEEALRSWFLQDCPNLQILLGVASLDDPAAKTARELIAAHPEREAALIHNPQSYGANAKVSQLIHMAQRASYDRLIISDADVKVPPDLVREVAHILDRPGVALVNTFYRLANPSTPAMQLEALSVNVDFWSQVLQARTLAPLDFALGAVMALRKDSLAKAGGFEALADCLADDFHLANRIVRHHVGRVELAPIVVECGESPKSWLAVWQHQLRWARTVRLCRPAPYFFSVLSNPTAWATLGLALQASPGIGTRSSAFAAAAIWTLAAALRLALGSHLQRRFVPEKRLRAPAWMLLAKDLLALLLWIAAWSGSTVRWRGELFQVSRDGRMQRRA